jgi:hypothetical protein
MKKAVSNARLAGFRNASIVHKGQEHKGTRLQVSRFKFQNCNKGKGPHLINWGKREKGSYLFNYRKLGVTFFLLV